MKLTKTEGIKLKPKKQAQPEPSEKDHIEKGGLEEFAEYKIKLRERDKVNKERMDLRNDSEYWCALCFQTRGQKEEFLKALGLFELGDKHLDGMKVAEILGVKLKTEVPKMNKFRANISGANLEENRRLK